MSPDIKSKLGFSFAATKSLNEYGNGYQREIYLESGESKVGQKICVLQVSSIYSNGRFQTDRSKDKESLKITGLDLDIRKG